MKINEIFVKNWEKISYFYLKIDYNLTWNLPEISLKMTQIYLKIDQVGQQNE